MMRSSTEAFVVLLLLVLVPSVVAQPALFHEQDRRWHAIAPDTMAETAFSDLRSVYQDGRRVLFAASEHGLLRSTDDGASWHFVHRPDSGNWKLTIVQVAAAHPDTLYGVARERIYKSVDGGKTWENSSRYFFDKVHLDRRAKNCSSGGEEGPAMLGDAGLGITVAPYNSDYVFAAVDRSFTLASRNGGVTWYSWRAPTGCGGGRMTFAVSPETPGRVYVHALALSDMIPVYFKVSDDWGESFETVRVWTSELDWAPSLFADTSDVLYNGRRVSRDGGSTWASEAGRRSFSDMFADGGFGVDVEFGREPFAISLYAGYDHGRRWHRIDSTLSGVGSSASVTIDRQDTTVYAATMRGLYAYARPGALATPAERPEVVPEALELEAYPNPVRERATVAYVLPEAGPVRLAVYDLLGREVAVLADEVQAAGGHRAQLEAGVLPAGMYVIRLTTLHAARVAKMTVTR